jgi:hypothetical protein
MILNRRFVLARMVALAPLLAPYGALAEQKTLRVGIMSAEDEDVWAVCRTGEKEGHRRQACRV